MKKIGAAGRACRVVKRLLLALGLGLFLAGGSFAQEQEGIEGLINESRSSPAAAKLLAQANAEPPNTTDPQELSIFHHRRGRARRQLGDYPRAVEDLRLALQYHQPGGKTVEGYGLLYRIEAELGGSLSGQGKWFEAIDHWKDVARQAQTSRLPTYMFANQVLSNAYSVVRAYAEAEAALKSADDMLPKLRGDPNWAVWQFNWQQHAAAYRARFLESQGRHAAAEPYWRTALGYAEKDVELKRGRFGRTHQDTLGALQNLAEVQRGLAGNLSTQGKYGDAEILARAALRGQLDLHAFNSVAVSTVLSTLGWTRAQQGDLYGAEKYYRYALAAVEGAKVAQQSTALAARRGSLGHILVRQSRWEEANAIFEERARGLRSDPEQLKRIGVNFAAWTLANVRIGRADLAVRQASATVASQERRAVPSPWDLAMHRGLLGIALAAADRNDEALRSFQESLPDLMQRLPGDDSVEVENLIGFWRRTILEGYLELLARMHGAGAAPAGLDIADESFRVADMARASLVQEAITATAARAQLPDRNLVELARREQDAANRIAVLNRALARLATLGEDQRLSKVVGDMRAETERLRREQLAFRADIRKRFPEYAELTDPRPLGLYEMGKALAADEALVSIYLGPSQSYAWTIGPGGRSAFRVVPVKRDQVEAEVRELRKGIDFGDGNPARLRPFDLARSHKLYGWFFAPDEALWKEARVLNVLAHGAFGELPAALLVTSPTAGSGDDAYRDAQWLVRKVAIAQLPSASAFSALRRTAAGKALRQPFIGFGDPIFASSETASQAGAVRNLVVRKAADRTDEQIDVAMRGGKVQKEIAGAAPLTLSRAFSLMGALPDTAAELREIAVALRADPAQVVFVHGQATEKNVKQAVLQNHRIVAFATHGIAPGEITGLDQPALALSNPALTGDVDNDGFLTMEEVLALKLDADWVVLSACNTASADGRGSEAVSGLGRAFFYAGARSLLVSNWAVETTSARLLTTELFKRQADNPQLTRAEALRQSMLDLMGKKSPTGFSYAHPAFWAPFSLVGDGGR